ncbi:DUF2254 domain-containing protein [Streptomyces purpurogeneiscleroticus]|uniref:DUF2254 domain-containing protein n=1 Tax=Streptomyces purpurogeneiscleroticus TaxID=68259 RepID=UPI001CBDEA51|nr:DUF2254 family protein [Streptomyces purpurogeneiscleroticus]MBZ4018499.1 hypothetical protein [Streptomyces purpurogeneiscleroticus]
MNNAVRTRLPHGGSGSRSARRVRRHGAALLLVAAGALLGWVLPRWERNLPLAGLRFDASTAQATLAAIAGSMITLAGFVVTAITLVVQTVQAMSPRLVAALGHFSRYLVLFGLLVGTALYALVALSHIRGPDVPRLSVTIAVGLVLIDAVAVLQLLASLRHAVTGGGLARAIGARLRTVIDQLYPAAAQPAAPEDTGPSHRRETVPLVYRGRPATLFSVDERALTRLAARHDVHVHFLYAVGDFIRSDTTVARLRVRGPVTDRHRRLARRVAKCVRYGPSRSVDQDAAYGVRLLADISVRALSPAVNDPTTAAQALDQIEDVLLRLSDRPLGPAWLLDGAGRPRISYPAPQWSDLVSLALDETLLYGSANPLVVRRLHALLHRLHIATAEDRKASVAERQQALERLAATALPDPLLNRVATRPGRDDPGAGRAAGEIAGR